MKKILVLFVIIGFVSVTTAQEKWNVDRRLASKPPVGYYTPLPDNNYHWENENHTACVYETPHGELVVGPNFRVLPNTHQQDELILKTNPVNPLIMFGGANTTVSGTYGQGGYWTTDGGATWTGTDLLSPFTSASSDPGPTIDKNGVIIFTVLDNPGMVAAYSTNNGTSWSPRITLQSGSVDKNFAGTDDNPTSAYYGRSYAAWSNFQLSNPAIVESYTTNGGVSWSAFTQVNNPPSGHYSQGVDVATGINGDAYLCWAAPTSGGSYTEDYCGFAKSTNGGVSWTTTENAFDMNGIRNTSGFNGWTFRVNSFPRIAVDKSGGPRNGWVYIVVSQVNLAPAGTDADVVLHRSTDGGTTWSAGIRVNQDALSNGKVQFFPAITVDNTGGVDICYYDNRNYPSVGDSCETYFSRSTDGGTTFTDVAASDHRWKVAGEPGLAPYGGDYIGISCTSTKIFPFWMDNKSGSMQAWTCAIDIPPLSVSNNNSPVPKKYSLEQNYPNPFNPTTNIKFDVPKSGNVKLTVYDILGAQVELLVNNFMEAGSYRADFHANNLSSGVYFYKLEAGSFSETRKMILNK